MMDDIELENLLYSVIHWLIEGGDYLPASMLLKCRLEENQGEFTFYGPRLIIERIQDEKAKGVWENFVDNTNYQYSEFTFNEGNLYKQILDAFNNVWRGSKSLSNLVLKGVLFEVPNKNWRDDLQGDIEKTGVTNQGRTFPNSKITPKRWDGLLYRSETEIRIAKELDTLEVLFIPNCVTQFHYAQSMFQEEPDFLVCHNGKWGILEVDGPWHVGKAASDHERDRRFQNFGILIIQRYDWERCNTNPKEVVTQFLSILNKS